MLLEYSFTGRMSPLTARQVKAPRNRHSVLPSPTVASSLSRSFGLSFSISRDSEFEISPFAVSQVDRGTSLEEAPPTIVAMSPFTKWNCRDLTTRSNSENSIPLPQADSANNTMEASEVGDVSTPDSKTRNTTFVTTPLQRLGLDLHSSQYKISNFVMFETFFALVVRSSFKQQVATCVRDVSLQVVETVTWCCMYCRRGRYVMCISC